MQDSFSIEIVIINFLLIRKNKGEIPVHLKTVTGLAGGPVVENPPANAGDMGLIPGLRRFHRPQSN